MTGARIKLVLPILLLIGVLGLAAYLSYKIGEKTTEARVAKIDVENLAIKMQKLIEDKLREESKLASQDRAVATVEREAIRKDAKEAKSLAKAALTKPATAVLLPMQTPVPVRVVEPTPTATMMPDTDPHRWPWEK